MYKYTHTRLLYHLTKIKFFHFLCSILRVPVLCIFGLDHLAGSPLSTQSLGAVLPSSTPQSRSPQAHLAPQPFCPTTPSVHGCGTSSGFILSLWTQASPKLPVDPPYGPRESSFGPSGPHPSLLTGLPGLPSALWENLWHQGHQPLWPCLPDFLPPISPSSQTKFLHLSMRSRIHPHLLARSFCPGWPFPTLTPSKWLLTLLDMA